MAGRLISITDAKKRDAQIQADWPTKRERVKYVGPALEAVHMARLLKATESSGYDALLRKYDHEDSKVAQALIHGDPEIELEQVGRPLKDGSRVFVRHDGSVLYAARVLQVVYTPDGVEKSRNDFTDVEATVREEAAALPWSGRLMPMADVVRRFAFVRKLQLRHVNGLTFDFLFEMAKTLHGEGKLLFVGAGPKSQQPLIFNTNGSPYRGFLEGRINDAGDGYKLVLHLSNLEIKVPAGAVT